MPNVSDVLVNNLRHGCKVLTVVWSYRCSLTGLPVDRALVVTACVGCIAMGNTLYCPIKVAR